MGTRGVVGWPRKRALTQNSGRVPGAVRMDHGSATPGLLMAVLRAGPPSAILLSAAHCYPLPNPNFRPLNVAPSPRHFPSAQHCNTVHRHQATPPPPAQLTRNTQSTLTPLPCVRSTLHTCLSVWTSCLSVWTLCLLDWTLCLSVWTLCLLHCTLSVRMYSIMMYTESQKIRNFIQINSHTRTSQEIQSNCGISLNKHFAGDQKH